MRAVFRCFGGEKVSVAAHWSFLFSLTEILNYRPRGGTETPGQRPDGEMIIERGLKRQDAEDAKKDTDGLMIFDL
jgi:hypothetical protein